MTDLLAANPALRRALTDPARDGQAKADLVERLLGGQVSGTAVDVVAGLARGRWSRNGDLTDAVEAYAVTSVLAGAEREGRLDTVEDELFRFARIIEGDQALRDAFSYRTEGADRKEQLVRQLLAGRAAPETVRLAVQAAAHPRGLRTEQVLEQLVQAAADRRQQLVAHVVAAAPLTTEQRGRLEAVLQPPVRPGPPEHRRRSRGHGRPARAGRQRARRRHGDGAARRGPSADGRLDPAGRARTTSPGCGPARHVNH